MKTIIPLNKIKPTESLIPQDKWDEISSHYNGDINSISLIYVYESNGFYLPDNGNKRATFLHTKGHQTINAYIREHDQDEVDYLENLVEKAEGFNVKNLDDLSKRIVPRDEYDLLMEVIDNY